MTSAHILFIPGVAMVGMFLGFILGTRAARNQFDLQQRRDAEREVVRAQRAAKKAAALGEGTPPSSAASSSAGAGAKPS